MGAGGLPSTLLRCFVTPNWILSLTAEEGVVRGCKLFALVRPTLPSCCGCQSSYCSLMFRNEIYSCVQDNSRAFKKKKKVNKYLTILMIAFIRINANAFENCTFYSKSEHEEKYHICYYFTESEESWILRCLKKKEAVWSSFSKVIYSVKKQELNMWPLFKAANFGHAGYCAFLWKSE